MNPDNNEVLHNTVSKTSYIIQTGYDPEHFGDAYWLDSFQNVPPRITRSAEQLMRLIGSLIRTQILPVKPKVIDVGAGPGQAVAALIEAGVDCDGCEFSPSGRRLAAERFNVKLMEGDLRARLPAESEAYDFANCVGVLTMIPIAFMDNAMAELARILKPGGILHVLLHNPSPGHNGHHLTGIPHQQWGQRLAEARFTDVTALCNPKTFGIGVGNEFGGIFRKVEER